MMRRILGWPNQKWLVASVTLVSLFFGQLDVGLGLFAPRTVGLDDPCCAACPCETAAAPVGGDSHHDHCDQGSPLNESHDQCPPGCEDCACCPGVVAAVLPSTSPHLGAALFCAVAYASPIDTSGGRPSRIFKPPRPSLV